MSSRTTNTHPTYVAFPRGINVGGVIIKMDALKKAFEALRFKNVRTLLASGNVLFETKTTNTGILKKAIEEKLKKTFGREIGVMVRSKAEIERLTQSEPFKGINVTPQTRLYVTFLSEKTKRTLRIPYTSADGNIRILSATAKEVCSVVTLSKESGTLDLMEILEKEFGKNVTTRNWNTILKVLNK